MMGNEIPQELREAIEAACEPVGREVVMEEAGKVVSACSELLKQNFELQKQVQQTRMAMDQWRTLIAAGLEGAMESGPAAYYRLARLVGMVALISDDMQRILAGRPRPSQTLTGTIEDNKAS
ncbi:MAG TPA: hypothetical protein VM223_17460 [Planctomycetota bacterium]|nr:hypothetical protein [Planctomycetota bacterium]